MTEEENKIENLIDKLECSYMEAKDILQWDKEVDKTADTKEGNKGVLPKEKQKDIKQYKNTKKGATGKQSNRKADNDKLYIMEIIEKAMQENGIKYEIENKERILVLELNGAKFSVTLAKKRS